MRVPTNRGDPAVDRAVRHGEGRFVGVAPMSPTKNLALLSFALALGACTAQGAPAPHARDGVYSVYSEVDAASIDSEVFLDGVLVAVATVDSDSEVVTLIDSGIELVSEPPADYDPGSDLERYHETVIAVATGMALTEAEQTANAEFRLADECGWVPFPTDGGYCIASWCGSCWALDCVGTREVHWISGCG